MNRTDRPQRRAWITLAGLAIVVGLCLRVYQIGSQILIDDEWHALHRLLHAGVVEIFTHFGMNDYSIPLTLYYRGLLQLDVLGEWSMRAPMLVAGVALPILVLSLLRDWASLSARVTLAGLIAISPLHVYLSRTARPYALISLLSFAALVAFPRWWQRPAASWHWAVLYVVTTVLGAWLHLLSLVFTLMPFVYYGVIALRDMAAPARRDAGREAFGRLLWLGLATAIPLALLLLPPLLGDWDALTIKAGAGNVSADSLWRALLMLFGTGSAWIGAGMLLLAAVGLARVWRRDRARAGYVLSTAAVGMTAILLAHPLWIEHQGVLARYALPLLPFLLWFVAEGIDGLTRWLRPAPLQAMVIAAVIAALFAIGPVPGWLYRPNQFIGHARFQFDYDPVHNPYLDPALLPDTPMPVFLRQLARQPPRSVTLVVAPWSIKSNQIPGPWYQRIHQQIIKAGMLSGVCDALGWGDYPESVHGIHLRNAVHVSALLRGDAADADHAADYLVIRPRPWTIPPTDRDRIPWPDMERCLPTIRAQLGQPVYRDGQIMVFSLAR